MRLFVTDTRGFIGSHFLRAAAQAGHHLVGLRSPGPGRPDYRVPALHLALPGPPPLELELPHPSQHPIGGS